MKSTLYILIVFLGFSLFYTESIQAQQKVQNLRDEIASLELRLIELETRNRAEISLIDSLMHINIKLSQQISTLENSANSQHKTDLLELKEKVELLRLKLSNYISVWEYLEDLSKEGEGYGMYTYVLTNLVYGSEDATADSNRKNFAAKWKLLINEIQGNAPNSSSLDGNANRQHYNLFIIPRGWQEVRANKNQLDDLPWRLSRQVLMGISSFIQNKNKLSSGEKALLQSIHQSKGPFLISILKPISALQNDDETLDLLYVDLSEYNLKTIPELVNAYIETLFSTNNQPNNVKEFYQFRLKALNWLIEGSIQLIQVKTTALNIFSFKKP